MAAGTTYKLFQSNRLAPSSGKARLNINEVRRKAEKALSLLPPFIVPADRFMASSTRGTHGRRRAGSGDSFWQFRSFVQGDDVSHIDWRRSARTDSLFVRQNEWETAQNVWIWVDTSPSMDFASKEVGTSKLERAAVTALALAGLLVAGGERIGYLGSDDRTAEGQFAVSRFASAIEVASLAPKTPSVPPAPPRGRSPFVILIGDFFADSAETMASLSLFTTLGLSGTAIQIYDPAEEDFPFSGRMIFEGPEEEGFELLPRAEDNREKYRHRFAEFEDSLERLFTRAGWLFLRHRTDHPLAGLLLQLGAGLLNPALAGRR